MKVQDVLIYSFIIILFFSFGRCTNEKEKPSVKKHNSSIRTEYNPVVLGKGCQDSVAINLFIPKPYPNTGKYPSFSTEDTINSVEVFLDTNLISQFFIDNTFNVTVDSNTFETGYKFVECKLPPFSKHLKDQGVITIKLFFKRDLITEYSTEYKYLSEDSRANVIKRRNVNLMRGKEPFELEVNDNSNKINRIGEYKNDIIYTHRITKEKNHYLSTFSAEKGFIFFKKDAKSDWEKIIRVHKLPTLKDTIPLGFDEFKEKIHSRPINSYSKISPKKINNEITFNSYDKVIGAKLIVKFNDCELNVLKEEEVKMGLHWGMQIRSMNK